RTDLYSDPSGNWYPNRSRSGPGRVRRFHRTHGRERFRGSSEHAMNSLQTVLIYQTPKGWPFLTSLVLLFSVGCSAPSGEAGNDLQKVYRNAIESGENPQRPQLISLG